MSNLITSFEQLNEYLITRGLSLEKVGLGGRENGKIGKLENVQMEYPLRLSKYYADLIDWTDSADPLRKIAIPSADEDFTEAYELRDPIGDHAREAVPGLIHRYPDRCLLLLTTHCRIHCRFCFRREVVGRGRPFNLEAIGKYLETHTEIKEIIFSGGDPFTFTPAFLGQMLDRFASVEHIERIRFHTRIPAVDPDSISQEYIELLQSISQKVIVVIHADHPREVSLQFGEVLQKMLDANCLVLSQSVLLKDINDSPEILSDLFQKLVQVGVKPYYLHHPDKVVHTSHFRVSIEKGKEIFSSLRGHLSSICLPEYVLDVPGGFGKVPVMWLQKIDDNTYKAKTFEGKEVVYEDPGED